MTSLLHFVVGVCIGLSSEEWMIHAFVPFFWGCCVCLYFSLYRQDELMRFVEKGERLRTKKHLTRSPLLIYFASIYIPATALALTGSLGSAFVMNFLKWG